MGEANGSEVCVGCSLGDAGGDGESDGEGLGVGDGPQAATSAAALSSAAIRTRNLIPGPLERVSSERTPAGPGIDSRPAAVV
jgi:hypothetical protein